MSAEFPSVPRDRGHLLDLVDRAWARLEQTIAPLSEAQMSAPGPGGGWSAKDHLAHLTAWEQRLLAALRGRPAHEGLGVDGGAFRTMDIDEMNDLLYRRGKDRLLAEVLASFRDTHRQVRVELEKLTDGALAAPYMLDDPADTRRMVDVVVANSYEHYLEHEADIRALLG